MINAESAERRALALTSIHAFIGGVVFRSDETVRCI